MAILYYDSMNKRKSSLRTNYDLKSVVYRDILRNIHHSMAQYNQPELTSGEFDKAKKKQQKPNKPKTKKKKRFTKV